VTHRILKNFQWILDFPTEKHQPSTLLLSPATFPSSRVSVRITVVWMMHLDYRTVVGVNGPLVILDNVKALI
jgi:hypothetical protein